MYIGSFYFNTEENILLPADTPTNQSQHNRHARLVLLSCFKLHDLPAGSMVSLTPHEFSGGTSCLSLGWVEYDPFFGKGSRISKSDRKNPCLDSGLPQFILTQLSVLVSLRVSFLCVLLPCTLCFLWNCISKANMRLLTVRVWRTFRLSLGHLVEWYKVVGKM